MIDNDLMGEVFLYKIAACKTIQVRVSVDAHARNIEDVKCKLPLELMLLTEARSRCKKRAA